MELTVTKPPTQTTHVNVTIEYGYKNYLTLMVRDTPADVENAKTALTDAAFLRLRRLLASYPKAVA